MKRYRGVVSALGLFWLSGLCVALWVGALWREACDESHRSQEKSIQDLGRARAAEETARKAQALMPPIEAFLSAWSPHLKSQAGERELGLTIRSGLEHLAQQKLSLVTDQATTPEPYRLHVEGRTLEVQRVSLRASGESLAALVTWLGEAEALFPNARIDGWELSPAGGSNSTLRLTLSHPLVKEESGKKGVQR